MTGGKSIDLQPMMRFSIKHPIYILSLIDLSSAFGGFSPRESLVSEKPSSKKPQKN